MKDPIGQSIGRYHIIDRLGEGGMATVYRAYDTRLDCDVAIKVIRNEKLENKENSIVIERFRVEAQRMAQLSHPNIVPVIDYGETENQPYLVMKFIAGGTLKQLLGKPMPYQNAARLLMPIAQALEVAHQNNVVHRDVKPSNILITESGQPMLSDFGIAKIINPEKTSDALTMAGMAIGTPEYMAPEQWEGKEITGKADIYALGVVFYEMLTGHRPFQAETVPAVMVKALRDPLPSPSTFVKGIPPKVERILYKALARNPKDRYESMTKFAQDLESVANFSNPKSPHWLVPLLSGSLVLTIIVGVVLVFSNILDNPGKTPEAGHTSIPSPSGLSGNKTPLSIAQILPSITPYFQSTDSILQSPTSNWPNSEAKLTITPPPIIVTNWVDNFEKNTLNRYNKTGLINWNKATENVTLGNRTTEDNKIYLALENKENLEVTGKVYIPSRSYAWYESIALGLKGNQNEYSATLLFGDTGQYDKKISIMLNDAWGEDELKFDPKPGWYYIKVLIDYKQSIMRMKVWAENSAEPKWQVSKQIPSGWYATQIGFRHYGNGVMVDDLIMKSIHTSPTVITTPTQTPTRTPTINPSLILYSTDFEDGRFAGWDYANSTEMVFENNNHFIRYIANTDPDTYPGIWQGNASSIWSDYAFESRVRFKTHGIVLCFYNSEDGFYQAGLDYPGDSVRLAEVTYSEGNSNYKNIISKPFPLDESHWYLVRVEAEGDQLRMFVDNVLVLTTKHSSLTWGGIGFIIQGGGEFDVDDIRVWNLY